ncbi:hypothetical protein [Piscibacillus halophilus]|uniref:hypothetical protein n=1 Tax=Piscibacillus halophilus TaxID=571933 RepID=UPI00158ED716|nr:hypothetical protein [Piscibacillus halophilus]
MSQTQKSPRISVREEFQPLYKDFINYNLFQQHSDFFTFCCIMGQKHGSDVQGEHKYPNLFQYYTFNNYQRTILKALAFEEKGEFLDDPELIKFSEELADQGLDYLIQNELSEYVIQNENGGYYLNQEFQEDFLKYFFDFIHSETNEAPF